MSKEIVVNVGERETRIAVMEEGRLAELHVEREERVVGNLYKARVENVLQGMDASFVDIGLERNAFLYVGDVLPSSEDDSNRSNSAAMDHKDDSELEDVSEVAELDDIFEAAEEEDDDAIALLEEADLNEDAPSDEPEAGSTTGRRGARSPALKRKNTRRSSLRNQNIKDVLKVGQELLVQVTKGPRGTKGARVSTRISLPGRYLVLMPEADNIGVSRKIEDGKERDRLKKIGDKLREPGFGIIIRTEAEDKTEEELIADKDFLLKLWRQIQENSRSLRAPALVHQDLTLVYKTIRDVFGSDVQKLIVDDPIEYEKANELLDMVSPKLRGRIHLYTGVEPIFDHFSIESEIEKSLKRKVWLRSGGYLIFDETEALTVIDVNTGKFTGTSSLNETIVKTNTDAALETARQLRLRDIGGIIVIDFIDMSSARDKQQVIRALETALKRDRSRTKISSISGLGLVEMTRKRTGETVAAFMSEPCSHCQGTGKISSAETVSLIAERDMRRTARTEKKPSEALQITVHPDVAEYLIGQDGENIDRIEREVQRAIYVRASMTQVQEKVDILTGTMAEFEAKYPLAKRNQIVECSLERSLLRAEQAIIGWSDGLLLELPDSKRQAGQKLRVRITQGHRSYACAAPVGGSGNNNGNSNPNSGGRGVDRSE